MPMRRHKLTLAYDGSAFHGWQRQAPPDGPELRTVQGVLTEALSVTMGQPIFVQGASRTDAGVHAAGQVAHFDADTRIPLERIPDAINARLPDDVEVLDACVVPDTFDACTGALEKQYRYRLWTSSRRPLGVRHLVHHCWTPLDAARMNTAAKLLIGEHDFAAFAAAGHGRESTVRTIFDCRVEPGGAPQSPELHVVVRGNGFLYNMVRIIAGTLVEVGRGRYEPDRITAMLAVKKRELAGPTLPPQGLCLEWIRYEAE